MKEDDNYCGFLCSDIIERQQTIINDIKDFAQYNEDFAQVMMLRIVKMCLGEIKEKVDSIAISQ